MVVVSVLEAVMYFRDLGATEAYHTSICTGGHSPKSQIWAF
jgi:hypothetical protein